MELIKVKKNNPIMTLENKITVSIIIPVYNVEQYIGHCLDSVFHQSYKNIEIIIVDDCGGDNSMEIVKDIIKNSPFNTKIVSHSQNKGLSAARNSGLKVSCGEYIFFLDSDDALPLCAIEILVNLVMKYDKPDFVMGEFNVVGSKRSYPLETEEYLNCNKRIFIDYLRSRWFIMACNKLIKKEFLLNNNIFFIEGILHEDEEFSFRLALYANSIATCKSFTYNYIIRNNSISQNKKVKNFNDELYILESNLDLIKDRELSKEEFNTISLYLMNFIYSFIRSLIKDGNFCVKDKLLLKNKVLSLYKQYKYYNYVDFKIFIKKIIVYLPFIIQRKIFGII